MARKTKKKCPCAKRGAHNKCIKRVKCRGKRK